MTGTPPTTTTVLVTVNNWLGEGKGNPGLQLLLISMV